MKLINRIIAVLIVSSMLISNNNFVHAVGSTSDTTLDSKANVLNSLGILRGIGSDYGLKNQLRRSEAAAFIVRVLGEETSILKSKDSYKYTSYSDVASSEWYAPYVGYCEKNSIINGYSDKTFKPNDYLSEKAFLKMVLATLGYRYNIDYTWKNIYQFAYTIGIVTNSTYETKTEDNMNYTRGDVVNVLYEALKKEKRDTGIPLIQKFIDSLLISKDQAAQYGFIKDSLATDIVSVKAMGEYSIEIEFNEAIKNLTLEQIIVYEKSDENSVLKAISVTNTKGTAKYTITFETKQKVDKDYVLLISPVKDIYENDSITLIKPFVGFRPAVITSDFFVISKVEPISDCVVNVFYTQPINDNACQPSYYTLKNDEGTQVIGSSSNVIVSKMSDNNNGVSVYFKNYKFKEGNYELVIDGKMTSAYSVQLNDGKGDFIRFKANTTTSVNEEFLLTGVLTANSYTIQLDFNKVVSTDVAKKIYSYFLTNSTGAPIQILKAEVVGVGKSVRITTASPLTKGQKYNIMILNMTDNAKMFSIVEKQVEFTCSYTTLPDVKINSVIAQDSHTLLLFVDRPLDAETASISGNYQIYGVSNPSYFTTPMAVYYDAIKEPLVIKLFLPEALSLEKDKSYSVRVMPTVKDSWGSSQSTVLSYQFNVVNTVFDYVNVTNAKIVGENTVKVTFNKELSFDIKNIVNSNYWLSYTENNIILKKIPIGVIYIDASTLILKFDSLDSTKSYTLSYNKLISYGGIITDNASGKYVCSVVKGQ